MSVETLPYRSGGVVVLVVACLIAAALAGSIASSSLVAVITTAIFVAAVVAFAIEPFIGVVILAAAIPMENLFIVAPGLTALKFMGALLAFVWFFRKLLRGERFKPLLSSPLTLAAAVFLAFALASAIWADSRTAAFSGFVQLLMMLAWCLLVMDLVSSRERLELVLRVLVLAGLVAAALTLQEGLSGARRAGGDIAGSVNATAVVLLAIMPFAFYLLRTSDRTLWRLVAFLYVPASVTAIVFTYSRMNLLLLAPVFLLLCWQMLRGGRGRGWLLGLLGLSMLALTLVPWDEVQERLETVPEYVEGAVQPVGTGVSEFSGRGYHIMVALKMGLDHPLRGVGYNNYGREFTRNYQYRVRGAPKYFGSFRSPHSGWPGIFAELGGIGVVLWALLLAVMLKPVARLWLDTRRRDRTGRAHALAQALGVSFLLYALPYGFYFQTHKEKLLWALFGLIVVAHGLHRAAGSAESDDPGERAATGAPAGPVRTSGRSAP